MDILGAIGKLYTFILLVLLFLGSGLAVWAGINNFMNKKEKIKESTDKIKTTLNSGIQSVKNNNIIGGINMKNSGFIKLAVFSFVGIIISAAILAALPKYSGSNTNNMNMGTQYGATAMNMQAGMNSNTDFSSIQQQLNQIQQQIYQLQNQISGNSSSMNGMQNNSGSSMNNNAMNNTSNNSSMSNSNSNSNSSSGNMSSMPMM